MTKDRTILIKNIFYMLTYAFEGLTQNSFERISAEEFENIHDLFAEILIQGLAKQLKQGVHKEYIEVKDNSVVLRGKLEIGGTIKNVIQHKQKLSCEFDELSENNIFNMILKTTAHILSTQPTVDTFRRSELKRILLLLSGVNLIDPQQIRWGRLVYHRNNQTYEMLINVCFFVLHDLLLTEEQGQHKLASFLSEQKMHSLFERFIRKFYSYHHPFLNPTAAHIVWLTDDEVIELLPTMKTDILLQYKGKSLIIDTKYYQRTMTTFFGNKTLHSSNMYQIFSYVKNRDIHLDGSVSGMLLYAKTDEPIAPDKTYRLSGNRIFVRTLDLNRPFSSIKSQLFRFVTEWQPEIEALT